MGKGPEAFRTISEVAEDLNVPKHVLRFWETKFTHVKPMKRGGGRRYYRPEDVELLRGIRALLHDEGYTIRGLQRVFREHGVNYIKNYPRGAEPADAAAGGEGGGVPDFAGEAAEHARRAALQRAKALAGGAAPASGAKSPARPSSAKVAGGAVAPVSPPALSRDQRAALERALAELEDCRRLLASTG